MIFLCKDIKSYVIYAKNITKNQFPVSRNLHIAAAILSFFYQIYAKIVDESKRKAVNLIPKLT